MAQNTSPIAVLTPNVNSGQLTAAINALTTSDGVTTIATNSVKCFTAGSNGSYVTCIRLSPYATAAATATVATTLRVYISTQTSGATTAANTWLIGEVSAAAQTAAHSTNATYFIEVEINRIINASYTILVTQHVVANANTGWQCVVFGGDY